MSTIPLPEAIPVYMGPSPVVQLHPLLTVGSGHIHYNFAAPISTTLADDFYELASSTYATDPPSTSLTITCHVLRKELAILPGDRITILDVLNWVHQWLHETIEAEDYNHLGPQFREWLDATFQDRCQDIEDSRLREMEVQEGCKVVDLLFGLRFFGGLYDAGGGATYWELVLETREEAGNEDECTDIFPLDI
jgi:hypothetical protein